MKGLILFFPASFLFISLNILWIQPVNGQESRFAIGVGAGYNLSPVLYDDDGSYWYSDGISGNFTPILTVRYGNKVSGVIKASYIQNSFKASEFGQYFPNYTEVWKAKIHQVHADFLFEHAPWGNKGLFYYLGPGIGIPVKVRMSDEYWQDAYLTYPEEHTYEEYTVQADYNLYVEAVFGLGGSIPVKEKNLIRIEGNYRIGLQEVAINFNDPHEARLSAFQFTLSYMRRL